jgi:L-aminopeptidase/D-esterase-like protein
MKGLTDVSGVLVGHASDFDALTGVTAILCPGGAVAGGDIRGSATGTQDWEVLDPDHVTDRIHGVVFAGGSAFGLEAASGVRKFLEQKGIGFDTRYAKVPIVPGAILYDLGIGKASVRPTREMGEAAAAAANDGSVREGAIGAGTGATVGKVLGMKQAMKSGVGTFTLMVRGVVVSALVVVNAVGDVIDPKTGAIVAGARKGVDSREFANSAEVFKSGAAGPFKGSNTTLVAVATNAKLTKVQARKVARLAGNGMARAISPVNMMSDGDLIVAMSLGREDASVDAVGIAAAEAVAEAILRAVRLAPTLGGVLGLRPTPR